MKTKLSKRLKEIQEMVPENTSVLWDTCCDHGLLGKSFLNHSNIQVNFVDQVDHIMKSLENELSDSEFENWKCFTLDAGQIEINNKLTETIVIAGVGGWTGIKTIQSILSSHGRLESTVIASVHKNQDTFENFMKEHGFIALESRVVEDRGKEYTLSKFKQGS